MVANRVFWGAIEIESPPLPQPRIETNSLVSFNFSLFQVSEQDGNLFITGARNYGQRKAWPRQKTILCFRIFHGVSPS